MQARRERERYAGGELELEERETLEGRPRLVQASWRREELEKLERRANREA